MGLLSNIKKVFSNNNKKTIAEYGTDSIVFGGISGYSMTEKSLLRIPEFYSAIDMIANSVAQTEFEPTKVEYINGDSLRSNVFLKDSPWFNLLNKKPNEFMDKYTFWHQNIFNFFLRGGFYLWINKTSNKPVEIIPIDPDIIEKVKLSNGDFAYEMTLYSKDEFATSEKVLIPYKEIIAVNYASLERVADLNYKYIYQTLLEQLGLKSNYDSLQLNQAPRLLAHVKGKGKLDVDDRKTIRDSLNTFFTNAKTQDKSSVLVTDDRYDVELLNKEGAKIQGAVDEKFVKTLMVRLANSLHIPLPKLNILDSGSSQYKSREGIQIDYLQDAISPIINKIISKLNEVVFPNSSTKEFKYSYNELLKFDKTTLGIYTEKMQGVLTTNELRKLNGFPTLKGYDKVMVLNGNPVDISLVSQKMQAEIDQLNKEKGGKDD